MNFRLCPMYEIVLHMLTAFLAASRTYLAHHILDKPVLVNTTHGTDQKQVHTDAEREELKNALIATQESAIIQILLETCLPEQGEEVRPVSRKS